MPWRAWAAYEDGESITLACATLLRWSSREPEQDFALDGFDQVAEPGVAEAGPAAMDFRGDSRLVMQRRQLALLDSDADQHGVAFLAADFGGLLDLEDAPVKGLAGMAGEREGDVVFARRVLARLHMLDPP